MKDSNWLIMQNWIWGSSELLGMLLGMFLKKRSTAVRED